MQKFLIRGKVKQPAALNNPIEREKKEKNKQNSLQSALENAYCEAVKAGSNLRGSFRFGSNSILGLDVTPDLMGALEILQKFIEEFIIKIYELKKREELGCVDNNELFRLLNLIWTSIEATVSNVSGTQKCKDFTDRLVMIAEEAISDNSKFSKCRLQLLGFIFRALSTINPEVSIQKRGFKAALDLYSSRCNETALIAMAFINHTISSSLTGKKSEKLNVEVLDKAYLEGSILTLLSKIIHENSFSDTQRIERVAHCIRSIDYSDFKLEIIYKFAMNVNMAATKTSSSTKDHDAVLLEIQNSFAKSISEGGDGAEEQIPDKLRSRLKHILLGSYTFEVIQIVENNPKLKKQVDHKNQSKQKSPVRQSKRKKSTLASPASNKKRRKSEESNSVFRVSMDKVQKIRQSLF
eukprot:jgi/Bigna1/143229/aug1.77_g17937